MYWVQVDFFAGIRGSNFIVRPGNADGVVLSFGTTAKTDGQAIRSIGEAIRKAELTWIDPRGPQWMVDLDDLKRLVVELRGLDWAKGKAPVTPEFNLSERPGSGFAPPIMTGAVTCTIVPECIKMPPAEPTMSRPKAFMSYSWDDESHKAWVKVLAARLRGDGVDVTLDRWAVAPGDQLPRFMETSVRENDFVLIVLTPTYKLKSDGRKGGVGYEGDIMTGEVFTGKDARKFIPILRSGTWRTSSPSWLVGKYGVDLSGEPYSEDQYHDLLDTLHGTREQAPPIGVRTARIAGPIIQSEDRFTPPPPSGPEPIRITGIIANEVGTPRNDGTQGSALYAVPFQLSGRPSSEWAEHFVATWRNPPSYSTRHRPRIARVEGDRIILDGTTVEEVAEVHRDTLKVVIEKVNRDIEEREQRQRQVAAGEADRQCQHKQAVEDAAKRISFD